MTPELTRALTYLSADGDICLNPFLTGQSGSTGASAASTLSCGALHDSWDPKCRRSCKECLTTSYGALQMTFPALLERYMLSQPWGIGASAFPRFTLPIALTLITM